MLEPKLPRLGFSDLIWHVILSITRRISLLQRKHNLKTLLPKHMSTWQPKRQLIQLQPASRPLPVITLEANPTLLIPAELLLRDDKQRSDEGLDTLHRPPYFHNTQLSRHSRWRPKVNMVAETPIVSVAAATTAGAQSQPAKRMPILCAALGLDTKVV